MNINSADYFEEELIKKAKQVTINAYSPHSGVRIGAAVSTGDGKIFVGCNIENSSYSLTVCAERCAFINAIANGSKKFIAMAIYSKDVFPVPCGACAQFIAEFSPDLAIIAKGLKTQKRFLLSDIFPQPFKL